MDKEMNNDTTVYPLAGFPALHLAVDGTRIDIRPMLPSDGAALQQFFQRISEQDRYYLRDDVSDPEVVANWAENLNYNRVIPLLALHDKRIVGEGTLHRRHAAARRHVGEVRITIDPQYRDKAIGRGLLHKLVEVAKERDLESVLFEIAADAEEPARQAAAVIGFVPVAQIPDQVRDADGTAHDSLIMSLNVRQEFPPPPSIF